MAKKTTQQTRRKRPGTNGTAHDDVQEVTRHIAEPISLMLWGKAAGRCEFAGCNTPLWKSPVTQEQVNIAQRAHIYAFSKPWHSQGAA